MATVLVVDDSAVDRRFVGGILGRDGRFQVEFAEDGAQALARVRQSRACGPGTPLRHRPPSLRAQDPAPCRTLERTDTRTKQEHQPNLGLRLLSIC